MTKVLALNTDGSYNEVDLDLGNLPQDIYSPSWSATLNLDGNNRSFIKVTVTGSTTINMINGGSDGQMLKLALKQDSTGNRTISLGTGFAFGTDITEYINTLTANKTDYIGLIYDSTSSTWRIIAIAQGY